MFDMFDLWHDGGLFSSVLQGEAWRFLRRQPCCHIHQQEIKTYWPRCRRQSLSHKGTQKTQPLRVFSFVKTIIIHLCQDRSALPCLLSAPLFKAKSHDLFYIWVTKLTAHRMFKKSEAAHVQNGFFQALSQGTSGMPAHRNGAMQDNVSFKLQ